MAVENQTIGGIVLQCVAGAVSDGLGRRDRSEALDYGSVLRSATLRIDGQPRTGWRAWAEAGWRVVGYALHRRVAGHVSDSAYAGSVAYDYRLRIRGYDIRRSTEIADGHVLLTTSTGWTERVKIGRLTREIPIHVEIRIEATETGHRTYLVGVAAGRADTSDFRCRVVNRFADKRASDELNSGLAEALLRIQTGGERYYAGGASDVLTIVRASIRIGSRR